MIVNDVRPEWMNVVRRLQSAACGGSDGCKLITLTILTGTDGNPIVWSSPSVEASNVEPARRVDAISEALKAKTLDKR